MIQEKYHTIIDEWEYPRKALEQLYYDELEQLVVQLKKNNINKIFDSQVSKHGKIFPGTNIKILKNNKTQHSQKFISLSSYKTNKKNNLQIHTL